MIKASVEILSPTNEQSFLVRKFDESAFEAPYHFHPEFELTVILEGRGKRYIGNHVENFKEGDLVFVGPNLPHCWKLDQSPPPTKASAVVVQFTDDFLGNGFFDRAELTPIKKLLENSLQGIRFNDKISDYFRHELLALSQRNDRFKALLHLMAILYALASSEAYSLLEKHPFASLQTHTQQMRMNAVIAYIIDNFKTTISLGAAAEIAHMTPNAFCKFFKKSTRKTFMEMVIEYRLNYARQLLVQTDKPVSEIAFESGFQDVSHFFKLFKAKLKLSPLQYRKKFLLALGQQ